jgi:hypothetical protein
MSHISTPGEQARRVLWRWIIGLRVVLLLSSVACFGIYMAHLASVPTPQACQFTQHLTGNEGPGCRNDPAMTDVGIAGGGPSRASRPVGDHRVFLQAHQRRTSGLSWVTAGQLAQGYGNLSASLVEQTAVIKQMTGQENGQVNRQIRIDVVSLHKVTM